MKFLLDTHVLIWAFSNSPLLSGMARETIQNGENLIFVSAVTAWEIAIKKSIGRLQAPDNFEEELENHRFLALDINNHHALATGLLPYHHKDPFDRLLISQANCEELVLLTHDKIFQQYDVKMLLI